MFAQRGREENTNEAERKDRAHGGTRSPIGRQDQSGLKAGKQHFKGSGMAAAAAKGGKASKQEDNADQVTGMEDGWSGYAPTTQGASHWEAQMTRDEGSYHTAVCALQANQMGRMSQGMLTRSFIMWNHEAAGKAIETGGWYHAQSKVKKAAIGAPHLQKMGAYLYALSKEYEKEATQIKLTELVATLTDAKMLEPTVEYFVCKKCVQNDSNNYERVLISFRVSGEMLAVMENILKEIWDPHLGPSESKGGAPPTKSERKTQQYANQLRNAATGGHDAFGASNSGR